MFKNENSFRRSVVKKAKALGWLVYYHPDSRKASSADSGFPDLVLAKANRLVFAELKMPGKYTTEEQQRWLSTLRILSEMVEVYVWRPEDRKKYLAVLQ